METAPVNDPASTVRKIPEDDNPVPETPATSKKVDISPSLTPNIMSLQPVLAVLS
jgi:hypothetical protein